MHQCPSGHVRLVPDLRPAPQTNGTAHDFGTASFLRACPRAELGQDLALALRFCGIHVVLIPDWDGLTKIGTADFASQIAHFSNASDQMLRTEMNEQAVR